MLAITVLCIWPGTRIYLARRQRLAVEALRRVNASVNYDYQIVHYPGSPEDSWNCDEQAQLSIPAWLRSTFGDDFFSTVV
jgi:hypothetical protein